FSATRLYTRLYTRYHEGSGPDAANAGAVNTMTPSEGVVTMSGDILPTPAPSGKPAKPYPDYPLFPHASGQWATKIRSRLHYVGRDHAAALAKYLEQKVCLHASRTPRPDAADLTVKELANHFLCAKQDRVDSGELSPRTWDGYKMACDAVVAAFGKTRLVSDLRPDDFAALRRSLAERWGLHLLGPVL